MGNKNEEAIYEYRNNYTNVTSSSGSNLPFLIENICLDGYSVYISRYKGLIISFMYRKELIENTPTLVRCRDQ